MAGQDEEVPDLWERQERFLNFEPEPDRSFGANVVTYFDLWRDAEGGGLSEYASARRLIDRMPTAWGEWSRVLLEGITDEDHYTNRYADFPKFISVVLSQWVQNLGSPIPPPHMGIPVEDVMAYAASPSLDVPMPPPYPPSEIPPPPSSPPPPIPHPSAWALNAMPEHNLFPEILYPMIAPPSLPMAPTAVSPPHPIAPPPSPTHYTHTARMSTMAPPGSPFRFSFPSDFLVESPCGHFEGCGSSGVGSSSSGSDSDHVCSACEEAIVHFSL